MNKLVPRRPFSNAKPGNVAIIVRIKGPFVRLKPKQKPPKPPIKHPKPTQKHKKTHPPQPTAHPIHLHPGWGWSTAKPCAAAASRPPSKRPRPPVPPDIWWTAWYVTLIDLLVYNTLDPPKKQALHFVQPPRRRPLMANVPPGKRTPLEDFFGSSASEAPSWWLFGWSNVGRRRPRQTSHPNTEPRTAICSMQFGNVCIYWIQMDSVVDTYSSNMSSTFVTFLSECFSLACCLGGSYACAAKEQAYELPSEVGLPWAKLPGSQPTQAVSARIVVVAYLAIW